MSEEGGLLELEGFEARLESLSSRYASDDLRVDSKSFCSDFCELVEEYTCRWQLPLPQIRILEVALCYFFRASSFLPANCDHVHYTLSSLALSVFELLLFFDKEPLEHLIFTFQECHLALARHQNVHLLQLKNLVQDGGPWASTILQGILAQADLPQDEADSYLSSELPVFLELRVRFLFVRGEAQAAAALARCCARHPTVGLNLVFLQLYLTWLHKSTQRPLLLQEVAELSGDAAVQIIFSLEEEEEDELLLDLSRAFLTQQLCRGDLYCLWDLIFIWSKLHGRMNTSKAVLMEESRQLLRSASNVCSIFPFIRVILEELGNGGLQFCVELCADALQSAPPGDGATKALIYKTVAGLLPDDLEVCRACALLVFFQERTVEAYKAVFLLYTLPDQEYHADSSAVGNHVHFDILQVLKKGLYFDPEFWNLVALRTNCLKLMSEKVLSAALEDFMEETWLSTYRAKEPALRSSGRPSDSQKVTGPSQQAETKKRHHKLDRSDMASKRSKLCHSKAENVAKKKGDLGTQAAREPTSKSFRRSFWQPEKTKAGFPQQFSHGEQRRTTRLSEKNLPKRRIKRPRWLLEDSGVLEKNDNSHRKAIKHRMKPPHRNQSQAELDKRPSATAKSNGKPSVNSDGTTKENKPRNHGGTPADGLQVASLTHMLELSLPDNELTGDFMDDCCGQQKGLPQMLLYKPTIKVSAPSQAAKTPHRKQVVLRARDASAFMQQLHCYARRPKGKGLTPTVQASVSTITRSSAQGSPPKTVSSPPGNKPHIEMKAVVVSNVPQPCVLVALQQNQTGDKIVEAAGSSEGATTNSYIDKAEDSKPSETGSEPVTNSTTETLKEIAANVNATEPVEFGASSAVKDCDKTQIHRALSSVGSEVLAEDSDVHTHHMDKDGRDPADAEATTGRNNLISVEDRVATEGTTEEEVGYSPEKLRRKEDGLTLMTEMVAELTPTAFIPETSTRDPVKDQPSPALEASPSTPYKTLTTSGSASTAELEGKPAKEIKQDVDAELSGNEDLAIGLQESQESLLEYCCTLCNKVFKGQRVVMHAMFHYRRDKCMFCGMLFKDDLLAMMHLSSHLENLKKCKESADCRVRKNHTEVGPHNRPAAHEAASPAVRRRGRLRKSTTSPKPPNTPDCTSSDSRSLRSSSKESTDLTSQTHKQKVNRHISRSQGKLMEAKQEASAREGLQTLELALEGTSCPERNISDEHLQPDSQAMEEVLMTKPVQEFKKMSPSPSKADKTATTEQEEYASMGNSTETSEKVLCPVDGCSWHTVPSRNRVALLYHALDNHHDDSRALELTFRLSKGHCGVCMRVLWSFQHYVHHMERHRLTPRHPCLHQGCDARFKTGIEMRRHTRRHDPLQAVCCLPGCSRIFICLWALNLHEREHYTSKDTKPAKKVLLKPQSKVQHEQVGEMRMVPQCVEALLLKANEESVVEATAEMEQSQIEESRRSKSSNATSNLTYEDSSVCEERQKLPKRDAGLKNLSVHKTHKASTSLLVTANGNMKQRFKKKLPIEVEGRRKRGRPLGSTKRRKTVADEKVASVRTPDAFSEQSTSQSKDLSGTSSPSPSAAPSIYTQKEGNRLENNDEEGEKPLGKVVDVATDCREEFTDPTNSVNQQQQQKKQNVIQKDSANETSVPPGAGDSSNQTTSSAVDRKAEKFPVMHKNASTALSDSSKGEKKQMVNCMEAGPKGVKKLHPSQDSGTPSASRKSKPPNKTKQGTKVTKKAKVPDLKAKDTTTSVPDLKAKDTTTSVPDPKAKDTTTLVPDPKAKDTTTLVPDPKAKDTTTLVPDLKAKDTTTLVPDLKAKDTTTSVPDLKAKDTTTSVPDLKAKDTTSGPELETIQMAAVRESEKSETVEVPEVKQKTDGSVRHPTYSPIINGQVVDPLKLPKGLEKKVEDGLSAYKKTPFIRPPPTSYLDERFTNMPKRRKEMSMFSATTTSLAAPKRPVVATPPARQRCINCFVSFGSAQELELHLLQEKCSNMFGFDSDEDNC